MILLRNGMFRRSEKSILVKMTRFGFLSEFSRFFQYSKNQKPQTYCKSTFENITITTQIILARKVAFLVIFLPQNKELFWRAKKQSKCDFTSKFDVCVLIAILSKVDLQ